MKFYINENHVLTKNCIPKDTTVLWFGWRFNKQIQPGVIPDSVTRIEFGDYFNQSILPNSIPAAVTYIEFGREFNKPIQPGVLPESLTHILLRARWLPKYSIVNYSHYIPQESVNLLLWCPRLGIDYITPHKQNMRKLCTHLHTRCIKRGVCAMLPISCKGDDIKRIVCGFLDLRV
jgi:hypothetical protein